MSNAEIIIRDVTKKDQGIVMSTWLKGQYWGSEYFSHMDQDEYFKLYGLYIQRLIDRPGTKIDCAVLKDAMDTVLAYIVYNDQTLYWSYTKRDYRKQGLCKYLLKDMDFAVYTGSTKVGHAIGKKLELNFNPLEK
jgi:hypothetical protein